MNILREIQAAILSDDAQMSTILLKPENPEKPLGKKALKWISNNAPKAASGVWKIGSSVLTDILAEAAMQYYGLKP